MALTRRFFTDLAAKYRAQRPEDTASREGEVWEDMVRITASALASQNGMFNYAKFYEACGVPSRTPGG